MSERCEICGSRISGYSCVNCERSVCSSCTDDKGLLCKICMEKDLRIRVSFEPLRRMVSLPLFVAGVAIIILGIMVLTWASIATTVQVEELQQQDEPGGFIYIFPLPFVIGLDSSQSYLVIPLVIAAIAPPLIFMLLMLGKFTKF